MGQDKTSHAHLFLEFVASAPEEGLREVLREKELETSSYLESLIRTFQVQGRLSRDVDAEMVAWLIACWAWTGDVANLLDATSPWHTKVSAHLMESVFEALSPERRGCACEPSHSTAVVEQPTAETGPDQAIAAPLVAPAPQLPASLDRDCDGLPPGAVFTLEEAAGILKVPITTVDDMVRDNRLALLMVGTETRIPRRGLLALLREEAM